MKPILFKSRFKRPISTFRNIEKERAATTRDITTGKKYIERKKLRKRIPGEFKIKAKVIAMSIIKGICTAAKTLVFLNAVQNLVS